MIQNSMSAKLAAALPARVPDTVAWPGDFIRRTTDRLEAVPQDVFGDFADSGVPVGAEYFFRPRALLKRAAERVFATA